MAVDLTRVTWPVHDQPACPRCLRRWHRRRLVRWWDGLPVMVCEGMGAWPRLFLDYDEMARVQGG
jgi:hypothetical protein